MSASDGGRSSKRSGNGWSRVKRWSANVPATYVEGTQMLTVDGAQQTAVVNPSWNRGYNPADCAWTREGGLKRHRTGDNNAEDRRLRHKSKMSTLCPKTEPLGSSNMPFDSEGIHTFDEGLLSFLAAVAPDEEAHRKARLVMHDVAQTLYNVGLQVALFGSWSTGLCIPSSDMDFAAVSVIPHVAGRTNNSNMFRRNYEYGGSCGMVTESLFASLSDPPEFKRERQRNYSLALRTVAKSMRSSNSFCRIVCIPHARVPLVKAVHSCGKAVDVSFQSDGLKTTAFLRDEFRREEFRRARGLIMLLKALLDKWELNDPSKNGLGSFPVSIMVLWFLREEAPKECTGESGNNYATQFVALLKYYGTQFDYLKEGIDYAKGCTFTKTSTELFIVNPLKPGANCASSATLFDSRVVPNLREAYRDLLPLLKPNVTACLIERTLGRVFGVSQKALSRGKAMWKHRQDARAYVGGATAQHQWDELTNMYVGNPIGV
ncbi:DNA polymerase sigma-like protein [Trypanosoma brucei brucei TREU927]|uniref:DNA polymerase sigma-like protein n=1 Tax=Trypanosoma brucei brucei (strain 927/4 GUTat10.1) TaxID=185431 RepID=Q57WQ6_TRYB2|nr:DNA polymerase sigma-like protein [Trypanosoma brucei brucei TREU927]AAX69936.1 DNA polymerase sigma-like protein [Trypanosoma brucei]AAZ12209.1 DNA polymerase sigma-like protein [Trypanosoma brucei brucei TREU927]